jgi:preprotein translocase subunit SecG
MMYTFLLVLFVINCLLLIVVILLQDAKGEGLASSFGGGFSTSMLGGRGAATFMSKATTYLGSSFLVLCIIMSLMRPVGAGEHSVIMDSAGQTQQVPETGLPLLPGAGVPVPAQPPVSIPPDTGGAGR